ncbi:MAG TPA: hypothetical protein VFW33_08735 [Gemmataceae bacterium]|nr:hypothetical protein [Gemmataceae bacterium]
MAKPISPRRAATGPNASSCAPLRKNSITKARKTKARKKQRIVFFRAFVIGFFLQSQVAEIVSKFGTRWLTLVD